MNRRKRTEILIKGEFELSRKLVKEIEDKYEVKEIESPNNGLVMIKMRETAKNSLFYLGEILVSEAKVFVNGSLGMGIVVGNRPELAYNLAVIDGAYKAGVDEASAWEKVLLEEEGNILKIERRETAKVLKTKVDFTTMDI